MAKLFIEDTRSEIGSEAEKMKFANCVNRLVTKFMRLDYDDALKAEMPVMERIYPIDFRAYEIEKRELWWEMFEYEIKELHASGFVRRDIRRPSTLDGFHFDNILLTTAGIRLIDVAIFAMKTQAGPRLFEKYIETELKEMKKFQQFFLNR